MFILGETGHKKITDQNKFSIQCSSYCWQTWTETKYPFILPVLIMKSPPNCAMVATNLVKHSDTFLREWLLPQQYGQCREKLQSSCQATGLGRWTIPSSKPTIPHCVYQPLNVLPLPLLLASWVAFYNLPFAVYLLTVSIICSRLPAWLQSAPMAG